MWVHATRHTSTQIYLTREGPRKQHTQYTRYTCLNTRVENQYLACLNFNDMCMVNDYHVLFYRWRSHHKDQKHKQRRHGSWHSEASRGTTSFINILYRPITYTCAHRIPACMTALLEIVPWRNTYNWCQKLRATDYYAWEGAAQEEDRNYSYIMDDSHASCSSSYTMTTGVGSCITSVHWVAGLWRIATLYTVKTSVYSLNTYHVNI